MKLSTRGRYSLRMMVAVARLTSEGRPVKLADVSMQTSISRHYLEQLCIHMKNSGLLKTVCGKNGGCLLGRPAESITAEQIIEAAIGPINIVEAETLPESNDTSDISGCREMYQALNRQIKDTLAAFTLADLAEKHVGQMMEKKIALA